MSLRHRVEDVALERSLGRGHLDRAGGPALGYGGRDQGARLHYEDSRRAVKLDAGRTR